MNLGNVRTGIALTSTLDNLPDEAKVFIEWQDPQSGAVQLLTPVGHMRSTEDGDLVISACDSPPLDRAVGHVRGECEDADCWAHGEANNGD